MRWDDLFKLTNAVAVLAWVALLFMPRRRWLNQCILLGTVAALSLVYSVLIFVYFFRVPGGGFATLEMVRALFSSDPVLLAGWIHYIAFDLLTGVWLAERLDRQRVPRVVQAPVLMATFMFGPFGLLMGLAPGLFRSHEHPILVSDGESA